MAVRARVQICIALLAAALLAGALTSAPLSPASATVASNDGGAASTGRAARSAGTPTLSKAEKARNAKRAAGAKAGRKAGAAAGAKAGRAAAAHLGARALAAGEKAGRNAGAIAGAKAGGTAGAKAGRKSGAGARAGAKAGAKSGARAGAVAGLRAAQALPPDCGAVALRKPNGSAWKCSFADNFEGNQLDRSKWHVMTSDKFGFGKRPDCFVDDADNVAVSGGSLVLTARKERSMFNCGPDRRSTRTQYSAGMVSTYNKWSQAYGRYEFRAKLPYTESRGLQTSAWLWPDGETGASWPASGEIDVAEWYSQWPDRVVPYLHSAGLSGSSATNNQCLVNRVQDWHTYLVEWTPGLITISYDGKVCLRNTRAGAPFNKPYIISMFHGFGLKKNVPNSTTPTVSRAQFAWVRVWS